jgi:hypothetical protein
MAGLQRMIEVVVFYNGWWLRKLVRCWKYISRSRIYGRSYCFEGIPASNSVAALIQGLKTSRIIRFGDGKAVLAWIVT